MDVQETHTELRYRARCSKWFLVLVLRKPWKGQGHIKADTPNSSIKYTNSDSHNQERSFREISYPKRCAQGWKNKSLCLHHRRLSKRFQRWEEKLNVNQLISFKLQLVVGRKYEKESLAIISCIKAKPNLLYSGIGIFLNSQESSPVRI